MACGAKESVMDSLQEQRAKLCGHVPELSCSRNFSFCPFSFVNFRIVEEPSVGEKPVKVLLENPCRHFSF